MGMRAADKGGMGAIGQTYVVDKTPFARNQRGIFKAFDPIAKLLSAVAAGTDRLRFRRHSPRASVLPHPALPQQCPDSRYNGTDCR